MAEKKPMTKVTVKPSGVYTVSKTKKGGQSSLERKTYFSMCKI